MNYARFFIMLLQNSTHYAGNFPTQKYNPLTGPLIFPDGYPPGTTGSWNCGGTALVHKLISYG